MEIFQMVLRIIGYICVFILILFLAQFTTKFLAKKNQAYFSGKNIKLIERLYLGKDKEIVAISYKDKEYLIGISSNIEVIDTIKHKDDISEEI